MPVIVKMSHVEFTYSSFLVCCTTFNTFGILELDDEKEEEEANFLTMDMK
jgi:hypothetical protein